MKYLKLFEQFRLDEFEYTKEEGIRVYGAGDPFKQIARITWPGVATHLKKWSDQGESISLVLDTDYSSRPIEKFIANDKYRSEPMGTWKDKAKPTFRSDFPKYNEVEFDLVSIEKNPEKPEKDFMREPWLKVVDKKGVEFLVPPFIILDIQLGNSVKDNIISGTQWLIDSQRATITNYKKGLIEVRFQDGSDDAYTLTQWKNYSFKQLDSHKVGYSDDLYRSPAEKEKAYPNLGEFVKNTWDGDQDFEEVRNALTVKELDAAEDFLETYESYKKGLPFRGEDKNWDNELRHDDGAMALQKIIKKFG